MRTAELEEHALTERERKNVSILEAIKRYGPISRTDISKLTKLNIVTVSNYVNNFIEQGIVIEKGLDISSGGRRPTIVVLNPKAAYVVGVDLGVFKVTAVLAGKRVLGLPREIQEVRNAFAAYEAMPQWQSTSCA